MLAGRFFQYLGPDLPAVGQGQEPRIDLTKFKFGWMRPSRYLWLEYNETLELLTQQWPALRAEGHVRDPPPRAVEDDVPGYAELSKKAKDKALHTAHDKLLDLLQEIGDSLGAGGAQEQDYFAEQEPDTAPVKLMAWLKLLRQNRADIMAAAPDDILQIAAPDWHKRRLNAKAQPQQQPQEQQQQPSASSGGELNGR